MAWTLDSHEKLARAGFLFRKRVNCRRCGKEIALYKRPIGDTTMGIDLHTYMPHSRSCQALQKTPRNSGNLFGEPSY